MANDPLYIRVLEKLGVNVTRLRWRLYRRSQRDAGGRLPSALQWLKFRHKICPHCGAVADRGARICASCERDLPSLLMYRVSRIFSSVMPADAPVTVNVFLGLMVVFFAMQMLMDGFSFRTMMSPSSPVLYALGSWSPATAVGDGQYWRFLSCGLLHGGLIHIGFNSFALTQIGPLVETRMSRARMLLLITLTQFGSTFASYFWQYLVRGNPLQPTVGASGWLFGLIGYGIIHFHLMGDRGKGIRDQLLRWALIVLVIGFLPVLPINNAAHIGGMLTGMAFAYLPDRDTGRAAPGDRLRGLALWACVGLWLVTVLFMFRSAITLWPEIANLQN